MVPLKIDTINHTIDKVCLLMLGAASCCQRKCINFNLIKILNSSLARYCLTLLDL